MLGPAKGSLPQTRSWAGAMRRPIFLVRDVNHVQSDYGISTVSTTWITPLDCMTSAMVTVDVPPLASVR